MPGMCLPIKDGGIGFDYRLAMGQPDLWIKLLKNVPDEQWNMWQIWGELTGKRPKEKYIAYAESHDQALVGDKTLIFRMCDSHMYTDMSVESQNAAIDRGMSLHKMIRMSAMTFGGDGYLNFMGNEFGHPEWIDFPREGNGWSHFYCRRQWSLADAPYLKYHFLQNFDCAMLELIKEEHLLKKAPRALFIDQNAQVLVYERAGCVFALNFSPDQNHMGYWLTVPSSGRYQVILSTDESDFGGWDRISKEYIYTAKKEADGIAKLRIYLPARTGLCMKKLRNAKKGN